MLIKICTIDQLLERKGFELCENGDVLDTVTDNIFMRCLDAELEKFNREIHVNRYPIDSFKWHEYIIEPNWIA